MLSNWPSEDWQRSKFCFARFIRARWIAEIRPNTPAEAVALRQVGFYPTVTLNVKRLRTTFTDEEVQGLINKEKSSKSIRPLDINILLLKHLFPLGAKISHQGFQFVTDHSSHTRYVVIEWSPYWNLPL